MITRITKTSHVILKIKFNKDTLKEEEKIVCKKHPDGIKKTCPSCRQAA